MTDLRDAVRALRSAPSFTIVALVVLTLGIGATTAIFSVADAVVLRGLPFSRPEQLVAVGERPALRKGEAPSSAGFPGLAIGDPQALSRVQPQNYLDWADQQHAFESIAAIAESQFTLHVPGSEPESLMAERVTASFFDVLRIQPAQGHTFAHENEVDGRHRVAVLSHRLWRKSFGAAPDIVGRVIPLDDGNYEVVGVMPAAVTYPPEALHPTDLWVPYVVPSNERIRAKGHHIHLQSIARLKPGVSINDAQVQMDGLGGAIEKAYPDWNRGRTIGVRPLRDHLVGANTDAWVVMSLVAVGFVLLIACVNVVALWLNQASIRMREVALRAALGANRWRLIRQCVVESVVLSAAGTVLAVILAWWLVGLLRNAMPDDFPRVTAIALNLRVLVAATVLCFVTSVLVAIAPASSLSNPRLTNFLKEVGRGVSAGRRTLARCAVVAQIALAMVLLVGSALFIGSFITLLRVDPGFNSESVLTMHLYSRGTPGSPPPEWTAEFAQIVDRLSRARGVLRASAVSPATPLVPWMWTDRLQVPGIALKGDTSVSIKTVTADYFQSLQIHLRSGRLFDATDRGGSSRVVVINESAARRFFREEDPVGRSVTLDHEDRTVVGVVADVVQGSLETVREAEAYLPMAQSHTNDGYLVIRTSTEAYDVLPAAKVIVLSVLPDVPVREVSTMDELIGRQTAQRRLNMLILTLFGLLGVVVSAVGVYGLLASVVSQRTREIGIRMALGASRPKIMRTVLLDSAAMIGTGLTLGGLGAWYLSAVAKRFLFGLGPHSPSIFVAAGVALSVVALVASVIPARRAGSVDPTVALRAE